HFGTSALRHFGTSALRHFWRYFGTPALLEALRHFWRHSGTSSSPPALQFAIDLGQRVGQSGADGGGVEAALGLDGDPGSRGRAEDAGGHLAGLGPARPSARAR